MNLLRDITQDHLTGHYVAKDVFKALAFALGSGIVVFAAWADYVASRPIEKSGAVLLLSFSFGVGVAKAVEGYYQRKTRDADGALAQPGTTDPPNDPQLMPQGAATRPTG